jgi:hypothetical protein
MEDFVAEFDFIGLIIVEDVCPCRQCAVIPVQHRLIGKTGPRPDTIALGRVARPTPVNASDCHRNTSAGLKLDVRFKLVGDENGSAEGKGARIQARIIVVSDKFCGIIRPAK